MQHQLILTILGANNVSNLSAIVATAAEAGCNILDSRQAIYGEDFALTMILEGSQAQVTRAECLLPARCQQLGLLSMMKRTQKHCKQNLSHLANVNFGGEDTSGIMTTITTFFSEQNIHISALRQNTFKQGNSEMMECSMVVSLPKNAPVEPIQHAFEQQLKHFNLSGTLIEKH